MFVLDVDGVLTDGQLMVQEDGHLLRSMNVRDGFAIKRAIQKGYIVAVITGGSSSGVLKRLQNLGVVDIYLRSEDKKVDLADLMSKYNLPKENILFMGDDLPDWEVMQMVGLPSCPADAVVEIMELSAYVSPITGGKGCVRDVIQKVMELNGQWRFDENQITQE